VPNSIHPKPKPGVDPLASNKGFWAQVLGVGDFYYELAVQVRGTTCLTCVVSLWTIR